MPLLTPLPISFAKSDWFLGFLWRGSVSKRNDAQVGRSAAARAFHHPDLPAILNEASLAGARGGVGAVQPHYETLDIS